MEFFFAISYGPQGLRPIEKAQLRLRQGFPEVLGVLLQPRNGRMIVTPTNGRFFVKASLLSARKVTAVVSDRGWT